MANDKNPKLQDVKSAFNALEQRGTLNTIWNVNQKIEDKEQHTYPLKLR